MSFIGQGRVVGEHTIDSRNAEPHVKEKSRILKASEKCVRDFFERLAQTPQTDVKLEEFHKGHSLDICDKYFKYRVVLAEIVRVFASYAQRDNDCVKGKK